MQYINFAKTGNHDKLFITGDNARFITSALTKQYMFDGDLTLKGLLALYRNTARTV